MLKKEKVYIPKDEKLRAEIIRLHSDMPVRDMEDSGKPQSW